MFCLFIYRRQPRRRWGEIYVCFRFYKFTSDTHTHTWVTDFHQNFVMHIWYIGLIFTVHDRLIYLFIHPNQLLLFIFKYILINLWFFHFFPVWPDFKFVFFTLKKISLLAESLARARMFVCVCVGFCVYCLGNVLKKTCEKDNRLFQTYRYSCIVFNFRFAVKPSFLSIYWSSFIFNIYYKAFFLPQQFPFSDNRHLFSGSTPIWNNTFDGIILLHGHQPCVILMIMIMMMMNEKMDKWITIINR